MHESPDEIVRLVVSPPLFGYGQGCTPRTLPPRASPGPSLRGRVTPMTFNMSSDHLKRSSRSSGATPSMLPITIMGKRCSYVSHEIGRPRLTDPINDGIADQRESLFALTDPTAG